MLSLAKVISAAAAASYYEATDDYYAEQGEAPSMWWGAGAAALGLEGTVTSGVFQALLDGRLPDGTTLHRGPGVRRAGTDLTFSAPKSLSLQALLGGDERLIAAHEQAVSTTLTYIEQRLAGYRCTEDGETFHIQSGSLVVAQFRHELSRAGDPQLHTHAVVVNLTETVRGGWRALDISDLYRQQRFLGAYYRAELALAVQQLGYGIRLTHADGRFELAHINDAQVSGFSSRSRRIEQELEQRGQTRRTASAREKELVGLATREHKTVIDRKALWAEWQAQSVELGIHYHPMPYPEPSAAERASALRAAADFAIAHLIERQSVVTHLELCTAALGRATGYANLDNVEQELAQRVNAGELVEEQKRYTTPEELTRERTLLEIERNGRDSLLPICQEAKSLENRMATSGLNAGQQAAATAILTARHRLIGIQGRAGTGKTHLLEFVHAQANRQGWSVQGLAPSAAAAHELTHSHIESRTIASFLTQSGNKGLTARTLLIVDESGMVPTIDMLAITQAAEQSGARLVLVGDTRQLQAVQAGKPFAQLQAAGMSTIEMEEIMRQRNATLRAAVEHAAQGDIPASLSRLAPFIAEIPHAAPRHDRMANDYAALTPDERAQTLLMAGTCAARTAINEQVRHHLSLAGAGIPVQTLERLDLTQAQRQSSISYQPGDLIEVQVPYARLGLSRAAIATVVHTEPGRVTLERDDGQQVEWRPALMPNVVAYRRVERELAVGDLVRFTANAYADGYRNGDRGTIIAITQAGAEQPAGLTILKTDSQRIELNTQRPLPIDHGYCLTVHSAQGQTYDRVLIDAEAQSAMANESLYYVAISRARNAAWLYTDDRSLLPEAMSRTVHKMAALDLALDQRASHQPGSLDMPDALER